ncbi:xaa-Pro dipeptidase-like isoform X2 [Artemia franciscana]|uniref:Xaa-Pro dipeptidase n=1 Tax=Artemia franciscana TaxID=6661 RepID=A0AA88KV50_ARTSF|nr:hypothetical protein QYM36_017991 [Artemia franciscana]
MYSLGLRTLKIPLRLYEENRFRLCEKLKNILGEKAVGAVVLLKGGDEVPIDATDITHVFRQESFFNWAFGVREPGFYGAIHLGSGKSTLFMPLLPEDYAVWMGHIETPEECRHKYQVNEVRYVKDIAEVLTQQKADLLLTLNGVNTDSNLSYKGAEFEGIENFNVDKDILFPEMSECRVYKSPLELEIMRYVTKLSSDAHIEVMKTMKPGMMEYQGEATFLAYCYKYGGCRHVGYTCICGSGSSGSILHYGHAGAPNEKPVMDGDMLLFDMGAEYCGYDSDITCSFPANGVFTEKQKVIYNAVLRANRAVIAAVKPGVSWTDMHLLANRVMLEDLKKADIVKGDVEEMMKCHLAAVFQPHGLGHLIGLDTHDVGGYIPGKTPERPKAPGLRSLRTARILQAGMCITVEPGCYFNDYSLNKALKDPTLSKYLNQEKIDEYRNFGGVRIEDDIYINENGCEVLSIVPRTIEEIEATMAEGANKKI